MPPALTWPLSVLQVLQDRGESGSRHGRATFAVLLLQASLIFSGWCVCVRQGLPILQHCKVLRHAQSPGWHAGHFAGSRLRSVLPGVCCAAATLQASYLYENLQQLAPQPPAGADSVVPARAHLPAGLCCRRRLVLLSCSQRQSSLLYAPCRGWLQCFCLYRSAAGAF